MSYCRGSEFDWTPHLQSQRYFIWSSQPSYRPQPKLLPSHPPVPSFLFIHGWCLGSLRLLRLTLSLLPISISIEPFQPLLLLSPNENSSITICCLEVPREQFGCGWSFRWRSVRTLPVGIFVWIPWIRFDFIELTAYFVLFCWRKGMLDHEVIWGFSYRSVAF